MNNNALKYVFYFLVVLLMANLGALTDLVLHPEIDYLDGEHLLVGGVCSTVTIVLLLALDNYISHLRKSENEIRKLNDDLEMKVQERTRQLMDAQDEIIRREKLATLGQIAGIVGHELRNPLGVMSNAVYYLKTVLTGADETTAEYLDIIKEEIYGAERIVSDLLNSVRTTPPRPEPAVVGKLLHMCLEKCKVADNVKVAIELPDGLPRLIVDTLQMKQVFINLIDNALEAMPDGGFLNISANMDNGGRTIKVMVGDTGTGIAPENIGKLFQPLYTTKTRGIGLGLAAVKNLTEANGGRVEVDSQPGKGTTFTLTLPAEEGD